MNGRPDWRAIGCRWRSWLQDGQTFATVPWRRCAAVFVGGTTAWKLGPEARNLVAYAKALGKWVHMGRVNTRRRIRLGVRWGVDSIDGKTFSQFGDLPKGIPWIDQAKRQGDLLRDLSCSK